MTRLTVDSCIPIASATSRRVIGFIADDAALEEALLPLHDLADTTLTIVRARWSSALTSQLALCRHSLSQARDALVLRPGLQLLIVAAVDQQPRQGRLVELDRIAARASCATNTSGVTSSAGVAAKTGSPAWGRRRAARGSCRRGPRRRLRRCASDRRCGPSTAGRDCRSAAPSPDRSGRPPWPAARGIRRASARRRPAGRGPGRSPAPARRAPAARRSSSAICSSGHRQIAGLVERLGDDPREVARRRPDCPCSWSSRCSASDAAEYSTRSKSKPSSLPPDVTTSEKLSVSSASAVQSTSSGRSSSAWPSDQVVGAGIVRALRRRRLVIAGDVAAPAARRRLPRALRAAGSSTAPRR